MYEVLKDLGLCIRSLLVKFVAFTANFLARTQPVHYQQVDSTIGVIFTQGFVSMKIQRIIWKPHGVSRVTKDFVVDRQLTKSMKKSSRFK